MEINNVTKTIMGIGGLIVLLIVLYLLFSVTTEAIPTNSGTQYSINESFVLENGDVEYLSYLHSSYYVTTYNNSMLYFDGVNDYIEGEDQLITAYPFTISAWAMLTGTRGIVFGLYDKDVSNKAYHLYFNPTSDTIALVARNTTGYLINTTTLPKGNLHHIVGIYKNATWRELYVDNVLIGNDSVSVDFISNLDKWCIGQACDSSPSDSFTGYIDEVRVYNSTLTSSQIAEIYNSGLYANSSLPSSNLVLWYSFNEASGSTVYDKSGGSNSGV